MMVCQEKCMKIVYKHIYTYITDLVQDCVNSSALAMELL